MCFNIHVICNIFVINIALVKIEVVPVHAMKAYNMCRHVAPRFLILGSRWSWMVNFMPRLLYAPRKSPSTHWIGAGWARQSVWTLWWGKESLAPPPNISRTIVYLVLLAVWFWWFHWLKETFWKFLHFLFYFSYYLVNLCRLLLILWVFYFDLFFIFQ
jgi:hypothetical protein